MLRRPLFPPDENGRMAVAALRLAELTGQGSLRQEALAVLGALAPALSRMSPLDAGYAIALRAVAEPVVQVRLAAAAGPSLARAARLLPVPALALVRDSDLEKGARICRGEVCSPVVDEGRALAEAWRQLPAAGQVEETAEKPAEPDGPGEE
jgi:uncharacterized protein YyaL (SSP411 family)